MTFTIISFHLFSRHSFRPDTDWLPKTQCTSASKDLVLVERWVRHEVRRRFKSRAALLRSQLFSTAATTIDLLLSRSQKNCLYVPEIKQKPCDCSMAETSVSYNMECLHPLNPCWQFERSTRHKMLAWNTIAKLPHNNELVLELFRAF